MIYKKIQQAGSSGIWKESVQKQLNISNIVMQKCLKTLEGKKIIKRVKSVKVSAPHWTF
jgi:DNA-directed RNA polymerase III subunit RPC6